MARSDRLLDLATTLSERRELTVLDMVRRYEISERTAYRDLATLQDRRIPITRGERGYRLVEGSRLRPLALTAGERAILRLALANPALRRQPPLRKLVERVEGKLDAVTALLEESPQALTLAGVERSGKPSPLVLPILESAIADQRAVEIFYTSLAGGEQRWRGVDPYDLFHRDGAWYLAARCHRHDEPRIFRFDRIGDARALKQASRVPDSFNLAAFLSGAWSIYRGERAHAVVLRADPSLRPLLENAHHHPSEELRELEDGALEYRVTLSHLEEIARWVVGFGGRMRAIGPAELRRRVREIAGGALAADGGRE